MLKILKTLWSGFLRVLANNSVRFKLILLAVGLALTVTSFTENLTRGLATLGAAILTSIFASFLLQVFPSDALESNLKAAGLSDISIPAKSLPEDFWFERLKQTDGNVDLYGRSLFQWLKDEDRRNKFTEILSDKIGNNISFRILIMSRNNSFLAALEEERKFLSESMIPKLETVERYFMSLYERRIVKQEQGPLLEVRTNFSLPFYRSITRLGSEMFVIPYFDDWETTNSPMFTVAGRRKPLYNLYHETFENAWNDKRSVTLCGGFPRIQPRESNNFEDELIRRRQTRHFEAIDNIRKKSTCTFDDFEEGWGYFLQRLGDLELPAEQRFLRDFTLISPARSVFRGYNLLTYPAFVAREAERLNFSIRLIVAVDTADQTLCTSAEKYVEEYLRKYYLDDREMIRLLEKIMLDEEERFRFALIPFTKLAANLRPKIVPFNVYGNIAVSISEVEKKNSIPRLIGSWSSNEVNKFTKLFDSLWEEMFPETQKNIARIVKSKKYRSLF